MKRGTGRAARPLVAATAAAATILTIAAPAAAVPPADPYQPYVNPGCLSFVEQPGVRTFRDMIMSRVGGTNGGIHACSGYEHGEGRAWDRMRLASVPAQAQQVQLVLNWLLATDSAGNPHAMARRLGVGYIIWNRQVITMWSGTSNKTWHSYVVTQNWGGSLVGSRWPIRSTTDRSTPSPAAPTANSNTGIGHQA